MDFPATQVYEDNDLMPTPTNDQEEQVGILTVDSKTFPISKGINKIGRHPSCNIVLHDQTVSKQHAEIEGHGNKVSAWLRDLNSSNRTIINSCVLRSGIWYELKDGSHINFGKVRATYKFHRPLDDSIIPETPAASKRTEIWPIIPGTPDSSLNNASTLDRDLSSIPGTQGDADETTFRRPSLPQNRQSENGDRKKFAEDSLLEKITIDPSRKRVDCKSSDENNGEMEVDIHNVETQKMCSKSIGEITKFVDIHDVETQQDINNIHDVETQEELLQDIQRHKMPQIINRVQDVHSLEISTHSRVDIEKRHSVDIAPHQAETVNKENEICSVKIQKNEDIQHRNIIDAKTCHKNNRDDFASGSHATQVCPKNTEQSQELKNSPEKILKISLTPYFEEECSELERSVDLLGSQNLLEHLSESPSRPQIDKSKTSTPKKSTITKHNNDSHGQNTDDDSIFDAVTQVKDDDENIFDARTQCVRYNIYSAPPNKENSDDSETDEEGVYQGYLRVDKKEVTIGLGSRESESEDSDTDQEGRFTEIASKEKRNSLSSLEMQSESKIRKNDVDSSRESIDIFSISTQRVNDKSNTSNISLKEDDNNTSRILKGSLKLENNEPLDVNVVDDVAPTQIVSNRRSREVEQKNAIQPTHEINGEKKDLCSDVSACAVRSTEVDIAEESLSEDIDYEMAPTQIVSDIAVSKMHESTILSNASDTRLMKKTKQSEVENCNDTLENNFMNIFEEVGEERIEEPQKVSTQSLQNMLQSSQCENELSVTLSNVDNDLSNKEAKNTDCAVENKLISTQVVVNSPRNKNEPKSVVKTIDRNVRTVSTESSNLALKSKYKNVRECKLKKKLESTSTKDTNDKTVEGETEHTNSKMNVVEAVSEDDSNKKGEEVKETNGIANKMCSSFNSNELRSKILATDEESDVDILEGLPEVTIFGTTLNRSNSTSSESIQNDIKKASKKSARSRNKSTRKRSHGVSTAQFSADSSNNSIDNLSGNEIRINVNNVQCAQTNLKGLKKKTYRTRNLKGQPVREETKSLLDDSVKVDDTEDSKILIDAVNDTKPIVTRKRKTDNLIENILPASKNTRNGTKSVAARRKSTSKSDLLITKSSPSDLENCQTTSLSQEERLVSKNAVVQIVRMDTRIQSVAEKFTKTNIRSKQQGKDVKGGELTDVAKLGSVSTNTSLQNTLGIKTTRRRGKPSDISYEVGLESQEVEMILSNAPIKEQSSNSEIQKANNVEQPAKFGKTRSSRKRASTRANLKTDNIDSSVTSDLCESDTTQFEVSALKPKRARISQDTSMGMESVTVEKSSKLSSKATTHSTHELPSDTVTIKSTRSSKKGGKQLENGKKEINELDIKKRSPSRIGSSIETALIVPSPCRTRQSMSSSILNTSLSKVKHKILFTGMNNQYNKLVTKLGGLRVEDPAHCTVLVTDKVRRTVKFLCALSRSIPIVSITWLLDSEKVGHFVDLDNYILKDLEAETKFGFNLMESLEKAQQRKLLEDYTVFLTPNVAPPLPELKSMIISCGGKPLIRRPAVWPKKTVVISCEKDLANTNKFVAKAPNYVTVQSTEFILTGILRQELDFKSHKLM